MTSTNPLSRLRSSRRTVLLLAVMTLSCVPLAHASILQRPEGAREARPSIPDVSLINQNGEPVRFYRDLVQGKVVAVNFVFTTCTTICPLAGANFGKLQELTAGRLGKDFFLISVSVDPVVDTPQRLRAWAAQFNAGPGWTLLTGSKREVDRLLKAMNAYASDKQVHGPIVWIGNDRTGEWTRADALAPPRELAALMTSMLPTDARQPSRQGPESTAGKYFSDVILVNQDGEPMRFYSDLLQGKTVVIDAFFAGCKDTCPLLGERFAYLQEKLGDRLGRDVYLISISVDPETDTAPALKSYARRFKAKRGWFFLTGKKENVAWALHKVGQYVEQKEDHLNLVVIGNEGTGLWKKAFGLAEPEALWRVLESVLNDER
jgi:protein SCO1